MEKEIESFIKQHENTQSKINLITNALKNKKKQLFKICQMEQARKLHLYLMDIKLCTERQQMVKM